VCSLFFERFVLFFCLKIERFVPETTEIWICGLYVGTVLSVAFISLYPLSEKKMKEITEELEERRRN
jgi:Na+/melibiose symporter-like transporter